MAARPRPDGPPHHPLAGKPRSWRPLLRSRLALAASVALLATGLLFLAGAFQGRPVAPGSVLPVNGPTADRNNDPIQHPTPPKVTFPSEPVSPDDVNLHEIFIQESGGTSYHLIVSPK